MHKHFTTFPGSGHLPPMGVDHGGREGGYKSPPEFGAGGLSPQILSCCKILRTRLLALQCRKMCFFASTAGLFYSKSRHASPPEFQSDHLRLCPPCPCLRAPTATLKYVCGHSTTKVDWTDLADDDIRRSAVRVSIVQCQTETIIAALTTQRHFLQSFTSPTALYM